MEGAVAASEGRVGDDAAPGLAHDRGADEARGLSRLDAEEDLADEVVQQLRRDPAAEGTVAGVAGRRLWRRHVARETLAERGFGAGAQAVAIAESIKYNNTQEQDPHIFVAMKVSAHGCRIGHRLIADQKN